MEIHGFFIVLLHGVTMALGRAEIQGFQSLSHGSSLSVEKGSDFLISPRGTFSAGFYDVGINAYCFSIWFTNSLSKTVVWMANRDVPVNGKQSKLALDRNGNLVLTDADGSIIWSTNTFSDTAVQAQLLETGNLILINQEEEVIWQSFYFPTDTLLPNQLLGKNTTLVSMRSRGTYFSGFYNFKFDDDNVLNLIYDGPLVSSVYWPNTAISIFSSGRTPYNSSRLAFFDDLGKFISTDNLKFNASDYGVGPKRRLTLDYDGVLRLYSLNDSNGLWEITWLPGGLDECLVHGLCGPNGICSYDPLPTCSCPYGFYRSDPADWSKGCSPRFNLTCDPLASDFIEHRNTDFFGYDLSSYGINMSFEACRNACITNCKCRGFGYALDGLGQCFPKSTLLNGYSMPSTPMIMHIIVPKYMVITQEIQTQTKTNILNCSNTEIVIGGNNTDEEKNIRYGYVKYLIAFVGSVAIIEMICIGLGWWYVFRKHIHEDTLNMGYTMLAIGFKRFTFVELKKATQNFKQEIGKGGFGTVYKGTLENGRIVAVKRLERILQGETEFWAEVGIIGRLNHRNLVKMWGFCAEGEHKLLVYEYMENGSLDKVLFSDSSRPLTWDQRHNIALGTAKGLAYIHEECLEWVLHCDIKPQNILLDENLEPKVTDFGLSKLFKDNHGMIFSKVCGTRGYLAPEWMMNLTINAKADVYSFGIVLLELLTGQSASGFNLVGTRQTEYNQLVQWVREMTEQEGIEGVIDPRLHHEFDKEKCERLIKVALLCVGEDRSIRPAMSKVFEILTGNDQFNPNGNISD